MLQYRTIATNVYYGPVSGQQRDCTRSSSEEAPHRLREDRAEVQDWGLGLDQQTTISEEQRGKQSNCSARASDVELKLRRVGVGLHYHQTEWREVLHRSSGVELDEVGNRSGG